MKRGLTIPIRQFGIVVVGLALLVLMSSLSQVTAAPPAQQPEPSSTPGPPAGEIIIILDGRNEILWLPLIGPDTLHQQDEKSVIENRAPIQLLATAGHWAGTTSRGYPMSFDVSSSGTQWSTFKLKTNFSAGSCSGTVETTIYGPATITNNQFSYNGIDFSFSGQFNSLTTASGSYAYNDFIPNCGTFVQSGTWTASNTAPPATPAAPSNLTALTLSQTQVLLSWIDNSNNETGFKIERSPNGASGWAQIATVGANMTSYVDIGLTCGTTYSYQMRANNGSVNSNYSNTATAPTSPCQETASYIYLPIIQKP